MKTLHKKLRNNALVKDLTIMEFCYNLMFIFLAYEYVPSASEEDILSDEV